MQVQTGGALSKPSAASKPATYSRPGVESIAARNSVGASSPITGTPGTSRPAAAQKSANGVPRQSGLGEMLNHAVEIPARLMVTHRPNSFLIHTMGEDAHLTQPGFRGHCPRTGGRRGLDTCCRTRGVMRAGFPASWVDVVDPVATLLGPGRRPRPSSPGKPAVARKRI